MNGKNGSLAEIEASGDSITSVIVGMGAFESMARRFLREAGLDEVRPGQWYSTAAWLRAFTEIAKKVGPRTLYFIGTKIPETALLPPGIDDVLGALQAIDPGYHLNHRANGRPMFDLGSGRMEEGIGHYSLVASDERSARMRCDNPYPCDFDLGIIHGFATRFAREPVLVKVSHVAGGCRKNGNTACEYDVEWR